MKHLFDEPAPWGMAAFSVCAYLFALILVNGLP